MAAAIELRTDFAGDDCRRLARESSDANQTRRLLALASIYDGGSRSHAAKLGGVGLQVVRDWVLRFNTDGPAGLIDRKARGAEPKLTPDQMQALVDRLEQGPIPAIHGVVRWRLVDLAAWVHEAFGVTLSAAAMSRLVRRLGYAKLTARPVTTLRTRWRWRRLERLPTDLNRSGIPIALKEWFTDPEADNGDSDGQATFHGAEGTGDRGD
jgi:transposase